MRPIVMGESMVEHLTDSQLTALASEQETAPEPWRQHVADCPACRDKLAGLRATWLLLGRWKVPEQLDQPSADWLKALENRVERTLRTRWRLVLLRAAAFILIAVGVGLGTAWLTTPAATVENQSQLAASSLYLNALSAKRSVGLEAALGIAGAAEVQP